MPMTPEVVLGFSVAVAAPLTALIFRVFPAKEKDKEFSNVPNHDHNGKYVSKETFALQQNNTELLADNLKQTTELLASSLCKDILEMKQHLAKIDDAVSVLRKP